MNIKGPFLDPQRKDAKKPWYLSYFAAVLDEAGQPLTKDGKPVVRRHRPYYETKAAALADVPRLRAQYAVAGAGAFVHDRAALVDYDRARAILPTGVSLETAARHYVKLHPTAGGTTIEQEREKFLTHIEQLRGKDRHYSDLKSRTLDLVQAFPGRLPNTIQRSEAMDWLLALPLKPRGKLNHKRAACSFFNWLLTRPAAAVDANPFAGIKRKQLPRILAKEVEFLPLETVAGYLACLERYDPELVAHEVVQLFAGVRADDEMADFRGEWVKAATREVVTPAEMTKTGVREVIDGLEENFWRWWAAHGREGVLRPKNYEPRWLRIRALLQVADPAERDELARLPIKTLLLRRGRPQGWPWNARRRTFCTYHVAKHQSAARTALILRQRSGERILHASYRGLGVTPAQGAAYFALAPRPPRTVIRPAVTARGIVRLQQDPAWRRARQGAARSPANAEAG